VAETHSEKEASSIFVVAMGLQKETRTRVWFAAIAPLKSKSESQF
jgi:hypothetical protein